MDNINRCFSEQELAKTLNLSYWSVRNLRLQQGLPHFKCGRRVFYRMEAVRHWFALQEQSASATSIETIRRIS